MKVRRHHVYQNPQLEPKLSVGCLISVYAVFPAIDLLLAHVHGDAVQQYTLQPLDRLLLLSVNQARVGLHSAYRVRVAMASSYPFGVHTRGSERVSVSPIVSSVAPMVPCSTSRASLCRSGKDAHLLLLSCPVSSGLLET